MLGSKATVEIKEIQITDGIFFTAFTFSLGYLPFHAERPQVQPEQRRKTWKMQWQFSSLYCSPITNELWKWYCPKRALQDVSFPFNKFICSCLCVRLLLSFLGSSSHSLNRHVVHSAKQKQDWCKHQAETFLFKWIFWCAISSEALFSYKQTTRKDFCSFTDLLISILLVLSVVLSVDSLLQVKINNP